jgi:hypothetical protein
MHFRRKIETIRKILRPTRVVKTKDFKGDSAFHAFFPTFPQPAPLDFILPLCRPHSAHLSVDYKKNLTKPVAPCNPPHSRAFGMKNEVLLKAIDARIRQLEDFRNLVKSNPDVVSLLATFTSLPGGEIPQIGNTNGEDVANKKGTFVAKVEETCRAMGSGHFTVNDAVKAFEERGNAFGAENKNIAMYSALKRLVTKGIVEISTQGEGSRPSYYRVVQ